MKITTTVKTVNRISGRIRGVKSASDAATRRAAATILREAESRVHRYRGPERKDEGISVADSLAIKEGRASKSEDVQLVLQVGSFGAHRGRPVAAWLERGTAHSHRFPYLGPAANTGRRELKREVQGAVQEASKGNG